MVNPDEWERTEPHLRELPGGPGLCDRIRGGTDPWPAVGFAVAYCTGFPAAEFHALLSAGDFDVRWPLSFAACYWGASSASVDGACARFLAEAGLSEQAYGVLTEYATGPEWLPAWRQRFTASVGVVA